MQRLNNAAKRLIRLINFHVNLTLQCPGLDFLESIVGWWSTQLVRKWPPNTETITVLATTILSAMNVPTLMNPDIGKSVAIHVYATIRSKRWSRFLESLLALRCFCTYNITFKEIVTVPSMAINGRIRRESFKVETSGTQLKPYSWENPTKSV
jgi:hypothetical protein